MRVLQSKKQEDLIGVQGSDSSGADGGFSDWLFFQICES